MRALIFLLTLLVAAHGHADEVNLVPNGDFARGLEQWKVQFPEDNEQKYRRNHEWVSLKRVDNHAVMHFKLSAGVAASEGVKAVTAMIPITSEAGKRYAFGAEVFSTAPSLILFIEGYQEDPEQKLSGDNFYPGFVRTYRATIHVKARKNIWSAEERVIKLPDQQRYRPTHVLIKLYAFHPAGEAMFRNVFLRPVE